MRPSGSAPSALRLFDTPHFAQMKRAINILKAKNLLKAFA
jgi:hypothetical protein